MLCTASASTETCSTIASAFLIRMWHLVMLTLRKNNPNTSRKSESVPFWLILMAVKEALVFICTWIFCVCQIHDINCHNYGHVLRDWSCENTKKVNFLFTVYFVQLQFFPIEWVSKILPEQVQYVIWHTCPAGDLEKKPIWIADNLLVT